MVHRKAIIHPSRSVPPLTSNYHHLTYLTPVSPSIPIPLPQQLSPETDRLRVAMVLMGWCQGGAEVIEQLLIHCGRDVMSHTVFFFFLRVSPLCLWCRHRSCINNHFPIFPPLAETCYQAFVGTEPDASETWSWYLLQLSRAQCSGESDQYTTHKYYYNHNYQ